MLGINKSNIMSSRLFKIACCFFMIVYAFRSQGQGNTHTHEHQCWTQTYLKVHFKKNWYVEADGGYRTVEWLSQPHTALLRGGIGKSFGKFSFSVGAARFIGYKTNTFKVPEDRLYQRINIKDKWRKGLSIAHTYRLEERFFRNNNGKELQKGFYFQGRIRYKLGITKTIKISDKGNWTPFLSVWNEILLNFGPRIRVNLFDENRFFAGLGIKYKKDYSFYFGYLNLYQQKSTAGNFMLSNGLRATISISVNAFSQEQKTNP